MGVPPRSDLAAVILAAGASSRMGEPKALLTWGTRTFLQHTVDLAARAGARPIIVVEGAHALASPGLSDAELERNEGWRRGPLSSLQVGLRRLPVDVGAVLVLTVDRPHLLVSTVEALVRQSVAAPDAIVQPSLAGKRGHPVLLPAELIDAVLALDPGGSLRSLLRRADVAPRRVEVAVEDPAVLDNIDRPEDLARLPDP